MERNDSIDFLESQIRECYGRVVWTHKTHEKCADILNIRQDRLKLLQILLSALTTSGIVVTVLGEHKVCRCYFCNYFYIAYNFKCICKEI